MCKVSYQMVYMHCVILTRSVSEAMVTSSYVKQNKMAFISSGCYKDLETEAPTSETYLS